MHFAALFGRLDESQAGLSRCLAPKAVAVFEWFVIRPSAVHQVQLDFGCHARSEPLLTPCVPAVNHDPPGGLAYRALLATDDRQTKKLVALGRRIGPDLCTPATKRVAFLNAYSSSCVAKLF